MLKLFYNVSFIFISSIALLAPVQAKKPYSLPEFTKTSAQEWLNSKPLTKKDLLGKVTLIDFWTFGCWNCYRSFPWLHGIEKKYKTQGFQLIGIHSPEFEHEKVQDNLKAKIKEYEITNPVMVDNDMAYWKALNNQFWPSYYLVDKKGRVRVNFIGETTAGSVQGNKVEQFIEQLLAEK